MSQQLEDTDVRIRKVIAESAGVDASEIDETSRFVETFGGDSMLAIEILAQLEREFGVEIPEENLTRMVNLAGVRAVVQEVLAVKAD